MDKILLVIVILAFILCVIWIIASPNKVMKQVKLNQLRLNQLRDIRSNINNALSLYDCLYIHINMYNKGFTRGKSLTSDKIEFLSDNLSSRTVMFREGTIKYIEGHYEADSEVYKTALATYKSRLISEVDLELSRYNY
jgi:hypothetical protein